MELLTAVEQRLLISLGLALIAGFIIGAERESRGKDAGISTHTMVIVGAMLFTFLSSVVDESEKTRIAAQIVTGIGFLGAGLILKEGSNVRNLTTAASIWVSGAVGMALGFEFYLVGTALAIVVAIIPRIPHFNSMSPEAVTSGIKRYAKKATKTATNTTKMATDTTKKATTTAKNTTKKVTKKATKKLK